ncbi:MAG: DUF1330 domain-containing protein [Candidatus Omnitrophota bacterium]
MAAYVIIDVDVKDQEQYSKYMKAGQPTIPAYRGKPLVRGGKVHVWEGSWQPKRMIVLEFKSVEDAQAWWNSSEYGEAKKLREHAAQANVICVEGF